MVSSIRRNIVVICYSTHWRYVHGISIGPHVFEQKYALNQSGCCYSIPPHVVYIFHIMYCNSADVDIGAGVCTLCGSMMAKANTSNKQPQNEQTDEHLLTYRYCCLWCEKLDEIMQQTWASSWLMIFWRILSCRSRKISNICQLNVFFCDENIILCSCDVETYPTLFHCVVRLYHSESESQVFNMTIITIKHEIQTLSGW